MKKVLRYLFDFEFQKNQFKAKEYLSSLIHDELISRDEEIVYLCSKTAHYLNGIHNCWNKAEVSKFLGKEINQILVKNNVSNTTTFDLKTKWFIWRNIFEAKEKIVDPKLKSIATKKLNILLGISKIFDLGS